MNLPKIKKATKYYIRKRVFSTRSAAEEYKTGLKDGKENTIKVVDGYLLGDRWLATKESAKSAQAQSGTTLKWSYGPYLVPDNMIGKKMAYSDKILVVCNNCTHKTNILVKGLVNAQSNKSKCCPVCRKKSKAQVGFLFCSAFKEPTDGELRTCHIGY